MTRYIDQPLPDRPAVPERPAVADRTGVTDRTGVDIVTTDESASGDARPAVDTPVTHDPVPHDPAATDSQAPSGTRNSAPVPTSASRRVRARLA
ncbi:MAG: GTP pyrophosphokinase, partial [Rhodococcus sp. (in: high G+C Gram-positive bacteria)]